MKNDSAIVVQGSRVTVLSSIDDYHTTFSGPKDPIGTWTELTSDVDRINYLKTNEAALKKINWTEVEAKIAARDQQSKLNLAKLFFTFAGRTNRAKYWLAWFIWSASCGVMFIGIFLFFMIYLSPALDAKEWVIGLGAACLAWFLLSSAFVVKRLHDRDKSGWWYLLFYVVPFILYVVGWDKRTDAEMLAQFGIGNPDEINRIALYGLFFSLAALLLTIWGFIELGCLRGTIGPNRYGSDPLDKDSD